MSDQRLRALERRWKETGAPEDEAAYLLERVRVGALTPEQLELAAYLGHEVVHGLVRPGAAPAGARELPAFARGLARWGKHAAVAFALGCGRQAQVVWKGLHPNDGSFDSLVSIAERWLRQPSSTLATRARALAEADPVVLGARRCARGPDQRRVGPDVRAAGALYRLGMAVAAPGAEGSAGEAAVCACLAAEATEGRELTDPVECEAVRVRATVELTAWALLAPRPGAG